MKFIENGKVKLFDNVIVDKDLPKYLNINTKKNLEDPDITSFKWASEGNGVIHIKDIRGIFYKEYQGTAKDLNIKVKDYLKDTISVGITNNWTNNTAAFQQNLGKPEKEKFPVFLRNLISKFTGGETKSVDEILGLFGDIKLELGKEAKYVSRIYGLLKMLSAAERMGQEALKERIFSQMIIDKYESILWASGFNKCISEEKLISLEKNIKTSKKKNLGLTYIKNYVRPIPEDLFDIKLKADLLEVFDNYVILHYSGDTVDSPTIKELKKDPILFGVIKDSRKLYYIGDWIDPDDDLTWETVENTIGKDDLFIPDDIKINI